MRGASPGPMANGSRQAVARSPVRVAVDAMGGDQAPDATVKGAVLAARDHGIPVWIVGHEDVLQASLAEHDIRDLPITLHHAPDVIGMDESPVAAIRRKPRCSIRAAFELMHSGTVDAVVSAGNSGAVMAGALFVVGRLAGVERPAIACALPAGDRRIVLLDAGANVDAQPSHLVQFAVMGDMYARVLGGISNPRVALLSNGEEATKGTDTTRAASAVLRSMSLNFVGYVEGRDVCCGAVDVVACDGFVGNAVLKAIEGFGDLAGRLLRDAFTKSWRARLGYLLARRALRQVHARLDYAEVGGAPLLGIDGTAVVAHGRSGPAAVRGAIRVAHESARLDVSAQIAEAIAALEPLVGSSAVRRRKFWEQLRGRLASIRDGHESNTDGGHGSLVAGEVPQRR